MLNFFSLRSARVGAIGVSVLIGTLLSNISLAEKVPTTKKSDQTAITAEQKKFVDGVAAVVNKQVITLGEVELAVQHASVELKRRGIQLPDHSTLQIQVLQRLILERIQQQEAQRVGIQFHEAEIDQAIESVAQRNKITPVQLRHEIEKGGMAWAEYRQNLREQIQFDRLRQQEVDPYITINNAEIDAFIKEQRRSVNHAVAGPDENLGHPHEAFAPLPAGPTLELAQILVRIPENATSQEINARRKKAESLFNRIKAGEDFAALAAASSDGPEALQGGVMGIRPVEGWPNLFIKAVQSLPIGKVSPVIQSANGFHILKVISRHNNAAINKGSAYSKGEEPYASSALSLPNGPIAVTQTHARHILIKPSAVMNDEQARKRLEQLRLRIMSGEDTFSNLAHHYSQDPSAPEGGDLGWVNPGSMVPIFEQTMNALKIGEISQPVKSPFGWHLVLVEQRRQHDVSDEIQRMQARQILFERRLQPAIEDWLEQLHSQAYIDNRLEKEVHQGKL